MKNILCTKDSYFLMKDIKWIDVPLYDELNPWNIIKRCKLQDDKELWKKLLVYIPELSKHNPDVRNRNVPKDREFFFNVLNTLKKDYVNKIVYNAKLLRVPKIGISDEIKVLPELRDIFTDQYSLLGSKGRTIK